MSQEKRTKNRTNLWVEPFDEERQQAARHSLKWSRGFSSLHPSGPVFACHGIGAEAQAQRARAGSVCPCMRCAGGFVWQAILPGVCFEQMSDTELRELVAQTAKTVKDLAVQIGGLSNKFGSFTEGLALPSLSKTLTQRFHAEVIAPRVRARKGAKSIEIDVLAYSNGARNEAYVVEVKSHLDENALEQIQSLLAVFPRFFPEHRSKDLYGILAGVQISDAAAKQAIKAGIYVASISDEIFRLRIPVGFRPRSFKSLGR